MPANIGIGPQGIEQELEPPDLTLTSDLLFCGVTLTQRHSNELANLARGNADVNLNQAKLLLSAALPQPRLNPIEVIRRLTYTQQRNLAACCP